MVLGGRKNEIDHVDLWKQAVSELGKVFLGARPKGGLTVVSSQRKSVEWICTFTKGNSAGGSQRKLASTMAATTVKLEKVSVENEAKFVARAFFLKVSAL